MAWRRLYRSLRSSLTRAGHRVGNTVRPLVHIIGWRAARVSPSITLRHSHKRSMPYECSIIVVVALVSMAGSLTPSAPVGRMHEGCRLRITLNTLR